jgi:hypothetical protein
MAATIQIILLIVWFALFIISLRIQVYLAATLVFFTYLFSFVVGNPQSASFYLLAYVIAIVIDLAVNGINTTSQTATNFKAGRLEVKGFSYITLCLIAGLVIYLIITQMSRAAGANIIGVPNLAISPSSPVGWALKPVFESALGIIENTLFFVVFDLIFKFGIAFLGPLVYLVSTFSASILFAGFHVIAYSLSISLLIYAAGAFILFIISRFIFKDPLPSHFAHYINNGIISASRGLSIVV